MYTVSQCSYILSSFTRLVVVRAFCSVSLWSLSLIPRLSPVFFFVLQFASSIIHGSRRARNAPRPSPFFALFRFHVLYWPQTKEQKKTKTGEPGNKTSSQALLEPGNETTIYHKRPYQQLPFCLVASTQVPEYQTFGKLKFISCFVEFHFGFCWSISPVSRLSRH